MNVELHHPKIVLSRIEYLTDMTRARSKKIDLGRVLEVLWPAKGRFFGLAGRTSISKEEMSLVHAHSVAELSEPWDFMEREFNLAWDTPAGESAASLSRKFAWSMRFTIPEDLEIPELEDDVEWEQAVQIFMKTLGRLKSDLVTSTESSRPKIVTIPQKKPVISTVRELEAA